MFDSFGKNATQFGENPAQDKPNSETSYKLLAASICDSSSVHQTAEQIAKELASGNVALAAKEFADFTNCVGKLPEQQQRAALTSFAKDAQAVNPSDIKYDPANGGTLTFDVVDELAVNDALLNLTHHRPWAIVEMELNNHVKHGLFFNHETQKGSLDVAAADFNRRAPEKGIEGIHAIVENDAIKLLSDNEVQNRNLCRFPSASEPATIAEARKITKLVQDGDVGGVRHELESYSDQLRRNSNPGTFSKKSDALKSELNCQAPQDFPTAIDSNFHTRVLNLSEAETFVTEALTKLKSNSPDLKDLNFQLEREQVIAAKQISKEFSGPEVKDDIALAFVADFNRRASGKDISKTFVAEIGPNGYAQVSKIIDSTSD